MKKAAILLAEGFEETEAFTVVDLLRRATVYVDVVSVSEEYMVSGSHGIKAQAEDIFDEVNFAEFDMLVLPGGIPGVLNLERHSGVKRVIKDFCERGKYIGAICAAPSILGEMGLLKGRRAASHPSVESRLKGAVLSKDGAVQDENIITGRGVGTAIAFALKLVEILTDEEKAKEIAQAIVWRG